MTSTLTAIIRVGTKKMIKMDFHEILPLDQFKSEQYRVKRC